MELTGIIKEKFEKSILSSSVFYDNETIVIRKEDVFDVIKFLKDEQSFDFLMDVTAVDYKGYPDRNDETRFEIVYNLFSYKNNKRLIIKTLVDEKDLTVNSITSLYHSADWHEREVYDMFGIKFINHPNLKRILMYDEFVGHPLRKDYPFKKRQPRINLRDVGKNEEEE
ncbi:MAG: NADH-quinone oxidoreductase subunit C [Elusimicrobiales bacterium]|jgi:NADH-quinone oxidoreductase subunit C|nr:NADH-quinone oxidoreductase subunit C [Elusimicrobiales bacterium]